MGKSPPAVEIGQGDRGDLIAEACYCLSLRKASRRLIRFYDRLLEPHGVTIGQFGILALVAQSDAATVQSLADALEMDQSAASRALAPLERDGLIVSREDAEDRRRRIVRLSDTGRKRLAETTIAWTQAQKAIAEGTADVDLPALMKTIGAIGTPR